MAAFLCSPGCLLCQRRACPLCVADWMCDACWTDLQEHLWLEEYEADDLGVGHEDSGYAGDAEGSVHGSSTICPPSSDIESVLTAAACLDESWSPLPASEPSSSPPPTEDAPPLRMAASDAASTLTYESDISD